MSVNIADTLGRIGKGFWLLLAKDSGLKDGRDVETVLLEVEGIAKGRNKGYVFDTKEAMDLLLADADFVKNLLLGDNLYIRATDVPDFWWDGTSPQELETQKVDLTEYLKDDRGVVNKGKYLIVGEDGKVTEKDLPVVTEFGETTSDTNVPSEKLVKDALDGKLPIKQNADDKGKAVIVGEDGNLTLGEAKGGSGELSADLTSNVEVGGVVSGTTFQKGTSLEDVIKNVLVKYFPPTATFSMTPSTTLKLYGTTITSEELKVVAVKNTYDITEIVFRVGTTELHKITENVASGGTFTHTYAPTDGIKDTITLSVDVKDGTKTVTKDIKITFCYPTYYGTVADTVTSMDASSIQALTNKEAVNNKAKTWSNISMTYGKLVYAYPKSLGALTSIKDANNVDYINSYTRTEVTLTENGQSVVYYCYLLKDATGVSGFKQIYA